MFFQSYAPKLVSQNKKPYKVAKEPVFWRFADLEALCDDLPKAVSDRVLSQDQRDEIETLFGVTVTTQAGVYTQRSFAKVKVPHGRMGLGELNSNQQGWLTLFLARLQQANANKPECANVMKELKEAKNALKEFKSSTRPWVNGTGNACTIMAVGGAGSTALQLSGLISTLTGLGIMGAAALSALYIAYDVYQQADREHKETYEREARNLAAVEVRLQLACARWGNTPIPVPEQRDIEEGAEVRKPERNARGNALKVGAAVGGIASAVTFTALKAAGIGGAALAIWPVAVGLIVGFAVGLAVYYLRKQQIKKTQELQAKRNFLEAQLRVMNRALDNRIVAAPTDVVDASAQAVVARSDSADSLSPSHSLLSSPSNSSVSSRSSSPNASQTQFSLSPKAANSPTGGVQAKVLMFSAQGDSRVVQRLSR